MSSAPDSPLAEWLARNNRLMVIASIAVLTLLAWGYLTGGAGMATGAIAKPTLVITMWWVMMIAMMLPSAAPAILLYGRVQRQSRGAAAIGPSWLFLLGYLLAWLGFSLVAARAQLALVGSGWVDPMALRATADHFAGAALIAAGAYQLSPWKNACLSQCRSPAAFISRHWRPGASGAVRLGLLHGATCIGCCWLLMVLLFVGGVMNLVWVAALAALVAIEKIARRGALFGRTVGAIMLVLGAVVLVVG